MQKMEKDTGTSMGTCLITLNPPHTRTRFLLC